MSAPVENLVQRLHAKRSGKGWMAKCPAHQDEHPSLSIAEGADGRALLRCFAGCDVESILTAVGMSKRELFSSTQGNDATLKAPAPKSAEATPANAPSVTPRPLGEILDALIAFLRRYVVFQFAEQPIAIAAWIVHTWVFEAFDHTAYLFVFSAAKRSGKSRVLEVLEQLARNPKLTPGASAAALMRSTDEGNPPTMLLDEMDTIYGNKGAQQPGTEAENTRRFLNAGYRRGAKFLKCVGQGADINVKELPAFCPKAFAGIGRCLPDTVMDRSLPIELVRQSREEKAERFREREVRAVAAPLRAEIQAWAQHAGVKDALKDARPQLPEELNDRVMDITEPLIAIVDLAGGEWPGKLRRALVRLCGHEEDADIGVKLLESIKAIFDTSGADKLFARTIVEKLVADADDAPWPLWFEDSLKHDRPASAASKLARKLKPYSIKACQIRIGEENGKGYLRAQFEKEWKRYLPASQPPSLATGNIRNTETNPDSTRQNSCFSSSETGGNVSHRGEQGETQNYEGKTQNVSLFPMFPVNAMERQKELDAMSDAEYEAWFNTTKLIYPGDWLKLNPDETQEHWQAALKQALEKPCEVCGEDMGNEEYLWYHWTRHVARCPNCQQADWFADGYEIDDRGMPSCWDSRHTREERIAERDRNIQQKLARQERFVNKAWEPLIAKIGEPLVAKLRERLAAETEDSATRLIPKIREWLAAKARATEASLLL